VAHYSTTILSLSFPHILEALEGGVVSEILSNLAVPNFPVPHMHDAPANDVVWCLNSLAVPNYEESSKFSSSVGRPSHEELVRPFRLVYERYLP